MFQLEHFILIQGKAIYCSAKSSVRYFLRFIVIVETVIMERVAIVHKFSLMAHSQEYYNHISTFAMKIV